MKDHEPKYDSKLIESRLRIAREMISLSQRHAPNSTERSALWHLSRNFGTRPAPEEDIVDALCHLLHMAESTGFPPRMALEAAVTHLDHERGRTPKLRKEGDACTASSATTIGDMLVVYCSETGRFWNARSGWVVDPLEATHFAQASIGAINLPHVNCKIAEVAHLRSLISIERWNDRRKKMPAETKYGQAQ